VARSTFALFPILSLVGLTQTAPAQSTPGQYRVADSILVGQTGGDFYAIDAKHRRLYGAGPSVVDIDAKKVVVKVADTTAGGGFMLAPELGRGVVRNGTIFDLKTGAVIGHVEARGDASTYDPATQRAFLFGDSVAAVDVKAGTLVGQIAVDGAGESGVADGKGKLYLNLIGKDSIAVVDAKTLTRTGGFSVAPCKSPMGLAMDRAHRRLFAACDGALGVINADNGTVVTTVPTGGHSDENAFDPGTGLIFMPNGKDKGVTIVHEDSPDKYTVVQTLVDSAVTSNKVAVDEQTHRVYLPHRGADKSFWFVVLEPVR
jgi:hypothetical protein